MSVRRFAPRAIIFAFAASLLLLVTVSCEAARAKRPAPPPDGALKPSEVVWSQQKEGLYVTIEAAEDLNSVYGTPLGITLRVYQLSDLAKFTELTSTFDGVDKLLNGGLETLGGSALMSKVVNLQPGEKLPLKFDRMEGAKYFAVAAGYAHRDPSRCSAYIAFPVVETTIKLKRRKTAVYYTAGTLTAGVSLGAEAVTVTGGEVGSE